MATATRQSSRGISKRLAALALMLAVATAGGCRMRGAEPFKARADKQTDFYASSAAEIAYPAVSQCSLEACAAGLDSLPPRTVRSIDDAQFRDLRIDEAIQLGLANSPVLHDLGGAVLRTPDATITAWDPAIQETDPALGVEAALSAFDAQLAASFFAENNDRAINNEFFGGGTFILGQNAAVQQTQLSKRSVTGTELAARQIVEMDGSNAPGNRFPTGWTVLMETEVRHPLLQGGGMEFNRIAGPVQTPGLYNGVLVARLNTDVQLTEFEAAVRNLASNLENAYWDLYFAYRDLDAKIKARDAALETWRRVYAFYETERRGGEAEKEAQAREQYYRFQEEVENALSGRRTDGTRTGNGSLGGTFRGAGGVLVAERRLRRLMNLPASDGELLRPASEPILAGVAFDWESVKLQAAERRVELRRQKWRIRRRELELIASKNFLLPRLDAVGRYRWRGFGRDLIDTNGPPLTGDELRFDNAYENLLSGDFQEWQVGLELTIPIGYRQAHAAVRNAELMLARGRAVLRDQQQEVIHDAAGAIAEVDRAHAVHQTTLNRLVASRQQVDALQANFEANKAPLDLLLDAQRRAAEAESSHYRSLAEYAVAIKNVHFAKGTLLDFDGVYLAEGPWPRGAYSDAARRESRRGSPRELNYASSRAPVVSRGVLDQHPDPVAFVPPQPASSPEQPPQDPNVAFEPSPSDQLIRLPPVAGAEPVATAPAVLRQPAVR